MDKFKLKNADSGEKKVVFRLGGDWNHIKDTIIQAFPPLKDAGGIELLRTSGTYSKSLTVIESKFAHSIAKLKEYLDQAKVYIRPLQTDIPLSDGHG